MLNRRTLWASMLSVVAGAGLYVSPPSQAGILSISESQEKQVGAQAARQLEQQYGVSTDRNANALVQQIGSRIARVSDRPNLPWTIKVLNSSHVNAVALPGGYLYVFKGLLNELKGDRQMLAGVIAHEVAHVSAKHHTEMMEKQTIGNLAIGLLLKGKTRDYASMFGNIYALKWTRKDEYEADKLGVRFAVDAGYDPYGLPRFLQLLESKGGSGARSGPASWLSTHPATSERVKRAYQYADQESGGRSRYSESRRYRSQSGSRNGSGPGYLLGNRSERR